MDSSPLLLAIETASSRCAVALSQGEATLVETTVNVPRAHAMWLTPMIDQVLGMAGVTASALHGVAVSMGPGSYTGLRIGVSTAKGLCFSHGLPLIGVPTLDALALEALPAGQPGEIIVAALPSRRDEVYLASYRIGPAGDLILLTPPSALAWEAIAPTVGTAHTAFRAIGEAAAIVARHLALDYVVHIVHERGPSAAAVARLGLARLLAGDVAHLADFEPLYVNAFIPREKSGTPFDRLPPGGG